MTTAFLLDSALKVSLVLGVALVAVRVLRARSAAIRHGVLSAALLCATMIPAFNLLLPRLNVPVSRTVSRPHVDEMPETLPTSIEFAFESPSSGSTTDITEVPKRIAPAPAIAVPWNDVAKWIWLTGVVLSFALLLAGMVRLAWISSRSSPVQTNRWVRHADAVSREYDIRKPLLLLRSRNRSILATWGFLRPAVVLPADSEEWPEHRIEIVLSHEFAHIRRGDWLIQILAAGVRALHWFNPLAWIVCRRLELECERACDDAVLRRGFSPTEYAAVLLEFAKSLKGRNAEWALTLPMARRSTLNQRFRALFQADSNRNEITRPSVVIAVTAFLAISMPVAALRATAQTSMASAPSTATVVQTLPAPSSIGTVSPLVSTVAAAIAMQDSPLQAGMARIDGIVVRADNGSPIPGATVELQLAGQHPPDTNSYETTTDFQGRFSFPAVAPTDYRVVASTYAAGYVITAWGKNSANPRGAPLSVKAGQRLNDLKISMTPTGSITGRVIDTDGEPVPRAQVLALRTAYREGKKVLKVVQSVPANDLGDYRLYWLPPGSYYVSAKPETPERRASTSIVVLPGVETNYEIATDPTIIRRPLEGGGMAEDVYVPVYYPGAVDAHSARLLEVRPGQNLGGIQIDVSAGRLPGRHLRGTVLNAMTGRPGAYTQITILSPNPSDMSFVPNAQSDASGRFDVAGVVPGKYFLSAVPMVPNASRAGAFNMDRSAARAFMPVEVGGSDVEDLRVVVGPFISLTGRIVLEGRGPDDPDLARLRLTNNRVSVAGPATRVDAPIPSPNPGSGNISFVQPPGQYEFTIAGLTPNMYVKSLRLGSIDLLAGPILLSSQPQSEVDALIGMDAGSVSGRVMNAKREPAPGATVVLVPNVPRRERRDLYRVVTSDASGNFQFQGIEPAGYRVFAWEDVEPGVWMDPEFMRVQEARGRAIQVAPSSRAATEVTVIPR
jgi:beta-lactamase regulating signal transducer with metallopeptidase domain